MTMAAIPSYGGVSIHVPRTSESNAEAGMLRPGAFYPPFQPPMTTTSGWRATTGTMPEWSAAPAIQMSTHARADTAGFQVPRTPQVGGVAFQDSAWNQGQHGSRGNASNLSLEQAGGYQMGSGLPLRPGVNQFDNQGGHYGVPASRDHPQQYAPIIGIPTELRNAVKVIIPFYSDTATSERDAAFWRSFEKCTYGMDDRMRLMAFEQCLKGKVDQEWWYNSRIDSFESLRVRFHNRFICQTPAQLWNRLRAAKRNCGESVEEWGDRIATMCEALNFYEPRMRYEFFLDGLRNKQMRAVFKASMVTSIPEACALLLYKNLHLPVEEEDEFANDGTALSSANSATSTQSQMLQQLQQMNQMILKQQQNPGSFKGTLTS
ncbi:hypothetical protein PC121_g22372 [Phytophthora cactorum]|nr:hypothetical protein PC120_g25521 [Phytophthora cactorum]KAG3043715.1 hypothetical protein PC121_g22372 [Phytophthora cactorum]KAG4039337.1 hypothetical protein PC123_g25109 [Phytophthora cactorum]